GGVLFLPALADIRAAGLLADGVQAILAHDSLGLGVAARYRRLDADPVRLAQQRGIRPVRLLGMARTGGAAQTVDNGRHPERFAPLLTQQRTASQVRAVQLTSQLIPITSRTMIAARAITASLPRMSATAATAITARKPVISVAICQTVKRGRVMRNSLSALS